MQKTVSENRERVTRTLHITVRVVEDPELQEAVHNLCLTFKLSGMQHDLISDAVYQGAIIEEITSNRAEITEER